MTPEKLHYVSELRLSTFNGIGSMLLGRTKDPDMAPWVYQQYAFVVLYMPVYLGRFYVVKPGKRGLEVAGWLSGAEFEAQYGPRVYWMARLRACLFPLVLWGGIAAIIITALVLKP